MKNEIKQKSFAQIHIIPFDIGYSFYDPLLMDNKKNLENAKEFMDKLKNYYANTSIQVINNYEIQMQNNIIKKFFCKKNNGADNALGIIKFAPNLSCYILTNGIGVFATALDLFEDGIRPIVLGNYCGSSGGESYHLAALKTLERPIGRNNVVMNKKINKQDLDNIVNDLDVKEK